MPAIITPVSQYDGALEAPENGDDLDADDLLSGALQPLADRVELAKNASLGALRWAGTMSVSPGGSLTSFSIDLGAISACVIECADGAIRCLDDTATTISQAQIEGGGGTLGAVQQWWYVYAYSTGGGSPALAYEISTTGPTGDLVWKSGSVGTKRYLGCFPTTAAGAPYPLRAVRGRYVYRYSSISGGASLASYTAAQSFTDLDLSGFVPPRVRVAHLLIEVLNGDTDAGDEITARVRTNGDTTSYEGITVPPAAAAGSDNYARGLLYTECVTDSSQLVEVEVSGSSTALSVVVFVRGFCE